MAAKPTFNTRSPQDASPNGEDPAGRPPGREYTKSFIPTASAKHPRRRITVRAAVAAFIAADLAAVWVIAIGVVWVVGGHATSTAVGDARDLIVAEGRSAIAPSLTDKILTGDPASLAALDAAVRSQVLSDRVVRVKVWAPDGRIVYSDLFALIGRRFALGTAEQAALTGDHPDARVSDLSEPENALERPFNKLLEVYEGMRTTSGQSVLFEAYLRFSSVADDSHRMVVSLLPSMVAGLALLFLAQIPMVWTMARRLEDSLAEEELLLRRALAAGEIERRHVASDLHDGAVQYLAGTALSLAAVSEEAGRAGLDDFAGKISAAARELRQGVRDLRTLIVAIAPPRLHDEGLSAALGDLISPLRANGVVATLAVPPSLGVSTSNETLLYRAAQEAVRNIARHAKAHHVSIVVTGADEVTCLDVSDDGIGFSAESLDARRGQGHVGLQLLGGLITDSGGRLDIRSRPGTGTHLHVELPT
jgi:two-component system NarL family sensor kinase